MRWRPHLLCLLLAAATLTVYGQSIGFDFVEFDDPYYVTDNPQVRGGLTAENVAWAFTTDTLMNWHPLTWLSYMLDAELFGLDPAGYHATNLLLHLINALLLFAALRALTGSEWRSALVAALFALHPLRVESVVWVAERKDVLSACFGLLSIWAYAAYARRGSTARYLLVAAPLALGLLAKPMLVTLPLVFVLLDTWPLERMASLRRSLVEKLPLLVLSAASSAVTFVLQRDGGAMGAAETVPVSLRAANALSSYLWYLEKTFWPSGLSPHYPHPYMPSAGGVPLGGWRVAGSAALLLAITALAVRARRHRYALVGWLWFLCMLAPTIGLFQVGTQALADRYTYLPQIGLFLAAVWGSADLLHRFRGRREWPVAATRWLAVSALVACAACSWVQARHWRDSLSLFQRALEVTPRNPTMSLNLGFALQGQGRIDEAIGHYRRALAIDPEFAAAHFNLGSVLVRRGELETATHHFRQALRIEPGHSIVHNNLGSALRAQGQLDQAIRHFRLALQIEPDDALAHVNLAGALHSQGRLSEAIAHYRRTLDLRPEFAEAHVSLGDALGSQGRVDEAIRHFRLALQVRPDLPAARARLNYALHLTGHGDEAR